MNSTQRNKKSQQYSSRILFLNSELQYLKQEIEEKKNILYYDQEINKVINKMKQENNEVYYNYQTVGYKNQQDLQQTHFNRIVQLLQDQNQYLIKQLKNHEEQKQIVQLQSKQKQQLADIYQNNEKVQNTQNENKLREIIQNIKQKEKQLEIYQKSQQDEGEKELQKFYELNNQQEYVELRVPVVRLFKDISVLKSKIVQQNKILERMEKKKTQLLQISFALINQLQKQVECNQASYKNPELASIKNQQLYDFQQRMINETYRSDYDIGFIEQFMGPSESNDLVANNQKGSQINSKANKQKGSLKLDLTKAIKIQEINAKKKEDQSTLKHLNDQQIIDHIKQTDVQLENINKDIYKLNYKNQLLEYKISKQQSKLEEIQNKNFIISQSNIKKEKEGKVIWNEYLFYSKFFEKFQNRQKLSDIDIMQFRNADQLIQEQIQKDKQDTKQIRQKILEFEQNHIQDQLNFFQKQQEEKQNQNQEQKVNVEKKQNSRSRSEGGNQ